MPSVNIVGGEAIFGGILIRSLEAGGGRFSVASLPYCAASAILMPVAALSVLTLVSGATMIFLAFHLRGRDRASDPQSLKSSPQ